MMDFDAFFEASGSFGVGSSFDESFQSLGAAKVVPDYSSPLEPLVFGDFSTGSYDPLLESFAATPSYDDMSLEDTPPLSFGSTRSDCSSPLLTSPMSELLDMPLFMSPPLALEKSFKLMPQSDVGLAPLDLGFSLDPAQIELSSPLLQQQVPLAGVQRTKKGGKKQKKQSQRVESVISSADHVEGETEAEARRRKARDAQRKCRAKKMEHVENLEYQKAHLEAEQARLRARRDQLRAELAQKLGA